MSAWDLAGRSSAASALRSDVLAERAAHAYLFAGPAGALKRTLADVFMRSLHCESRGEKPCDQCSACKRHLSGDHPDVHILESAKSTMGVDDVRSLLDALAARPMISNRHLALIPQAEKLTLQAQNALLKTLEEPSGLVTFILLAESPRDLLPTVASRVRVVRFTLPSPEEAEQSLKSRIPDLQRARLLARLSDGDVEKALALNDNPEFWALRERVKKALALWKGAPSSAPAARILKDDKDLAPAILESLARDCMMYEEWPQGICNLDMTDTIDALSPRGQEFLECVLRLKARISSNVSWINALECLFMELSGGK